ncbi:MAG: undecaprenyl-diphosphatase [Desulfobacteraceae bacterium]|nr:undecaprenyl-diphosphatase [Desulfobacteraceae bacterium]
MLNKWNIGLFNTINNFAGNNEVIDLFAIFAAKYLPLIFILWLLVLWFKKDRTYKNIVLLTVYSTTVGILLNLIIASFYFHPRPFMIEFGTSLIFHAPETSFPSDHATFLLSIAFLLSCFAETRESGLILLVPAIMGGVSRVYCGVHFPLDIIGSIIVSILATSIMFLLKMKMQKISNSIINIYNSMFRLHFFKR